MVTCFDRPLLVVVFEAHGILGDRDPVSLLCSQFISDFAISEWGFLILALKLPLLEVQNREIEEPLSSLERFLFENQRETSHRGSRILKHAYDI